ncbi:MAG: RNA polymerase factor sigma-54 [Verrucomicrobiota bacterium]
MAQGLYQTQNLSQQQILAPQMQQSLALLQAPTLELQAMVEKELQENVALEEVPANEVETSRKVELGEGDPSNRADPAEPPRDVQFDPATERPSEAPVDDFQAEFNRLVQMDQEWREHFSQTNIPQRSSAEEDEKRQFFLDSLTAGQSLQEDLIEQVRTSDLDESLRPVAEMIIGNIDDSGYLKSSVDELVFATNCPREQIETVLSQIQACHPPGVGARDLRECLMLQLERAGRKSTLEYRLLQNHMDALGRRKYPDIARAMNLSLRDVQAAAERIAHLTPRPGLAMQDQPEVYVVPEVFVQKVGEEYVVTLNDEHLPRLRINNQYKDLMADPKSGNEVRDYIRNKIQAGKFLIKSIQQRQQTILNIAREIVNRQRDFLEQGVSAFKPMTMKQVADVIGVHETTVSRAVSGKYMETPQGVLEMKSFFTVGVEMPGGEMVSNEKIKEMVSELFQIENPKRPLSDQEIVNKLKEQGVALARRTVAKYREELGILPSHLRRQY